MSAVPVSDPVVESTRKRIILQGDLPSPSAPRAGCRFHTRCPYGQATRCDDERPALVEVRPGHRVACHYVEEIARGEIQPRQLTAAEVDDHTPLNRPRLRSASPARATATVVTVHKLAAADPPAVPSPHYRRAHWTCLGPLLRPRALAPLRTLAAAILELRLTNASCGDGT